MTLTDHPHRFKTFRSVYLSNMLLLTLLLPATRLGLHPQPSLAREPSDAPMTKGIWFSIGPALRGGMDVEVTGSSYAETLGLNTDLGVGIGNANAYEDRIYDNGYVMRDASEGGGIEPNTTWNWGYSANSTADQYDPVAGTLSFHKWAVPRYSKFVSGGSGAKGDMLGVGVRIQCGMPIMRRNKLSMDILVGFQGFWGGHAKLRETAALVDITDVYDVAGISSPAFTDLNHRGTYDGPFDPAATPPYTVIPNIPATRTVSPTTTLPATISRISVDVDQDVYQCSLGAQIEFKTGKRLGFAVLPTVSMTVVDVDVQRAETYAYGGAVHQWSEHADVTKARLGLGVVGGVNLDLGKNWYTGVFGGFEWVPDKTKVTIYPNTVTLDTSGWVAGVQVGSSF